MPPKLKCRQSYKNDQICRFCQYRLGLNIIYSRVLFGKRSLLESDLGSYTLGLNASVSDKWQR